MIDAHHHFWQPKRGDYGWMPPDDPILSRPYGPADLVPMLAETGVTQTVLVQAAPTLAETEYLLGIADATPHVAKVVGWVDFDDPSQRSELERLAQHPKFAGVRPMIQNIPDDAWMLGEGIRWAFDAVTEMGLTFDALGFPRHLKPFTNLMTRHPEMRVVIDHAMKPQFRDTSPDAFRVWADGMTALAQDTQACCKLSGLVTEADDDWSDEVLQPCVDHLLDSFGPDRLMWGSDWPVARLRISYGGWHAQARRLTAGLSAPEQNALFERSARHFYRIPQEAT